VTLLMSSSLQIAASVEEADLVIGAVLVPGALAPKLVTREMIAGMKQALSSSTSRSTRAAASRRPTRRPTQIRCTWSTASRTTASRTCRVVYRHIDEGVDEHNAAVRRGDRADGLRAAVAADPALAKGVNVIDGKVTYEAVAEAHRLSYTPLEAVLPLSAV